MRMTLIGLLIAAVFAAFTTAAYAEWDEALEGMKEKAQRGLINALTGLAEFPYQIVKGYNEGFMGEEENRLFGVFFGAIKGIAYGIGRTSSGVADLAGFWTAAPVDNERVGLPLEAEYAWEEGEVYDIFYPDFIDATIAPMTNKFLRGAGNTIFGFVEIPQQIKKGISGGSWDLGITKGLWFWLSREFSGICDLATIPFANPEDSVGFTFDEKQGWETFPEKRRQE